MNAKDILDGETCELIAAQSVERGFKSEWVLTLRYEGHSFDVKAFAEHGRMCRAAGLWLPERYQGKQDYSKPYQVIIGRDEIHNERRVMGIFNQDGELFKLENHIERKPKDLDMSIELERLNRENRRLEGELNALRNAIANGTISTPQTPLDSLKSALDKLFAQYPDSSVERSLIANMLMSYAVLAGHMPLIAPKQTAYKKNR